MDVLDRGKLSEQISADFQVGQDSASTSPSASPESTVLPSKITDSYGHVMVLVPAEELEMGGEANIAFSECLKQLGCHLCQRVSLELIEPVHTATLGFYVSCQIKF